MTSETELPLPPRQKTRHGWVAPHFYNDLDATLTEAWRLLRLGATDRRSPLHTPAIATIREDGAPSVRTVVLRAADPDLRTLRFHTDLRSVKVRELDADPRVALHFYDPIEKIQLRVDGRAILHADDSLASEAWAASRSFSRLCYGIAPNPGGVLDDPRDAQVAKNTGDAEAGRENFAAVSVDIVCLEWLYLAARGHRRARFTWEEQRSTAVWLVP